MENPLLGIIENRRSGIFSGVASYCCANKIVIDTLIRNAKKTNTTVLIEATSNQVNQDLGYMGMNPQDFVDYVSGISRNVNFPMEKVVIGGDHLGPLPWCNLPSFEAMDKAEVLVRLCAKAGYKKIHLDATMALADDPQDEPLSDEIIAQRTTRLYCACEEEIALRAEQYPGEPHPVYIIGSEVPKAGGKGSETEAIHITTSEDFVNTVQAFGKAFRDNNLEDAWDNIIAIVVQPGVDFGPDTLITYDREKAKGLCNALKRYPNIIFEGHSTDFQSRDTLRHMVEDGIAILKVGPALTFALREAILGLEHIEKELVPESKQSHYREIFEGVMCEIDKHWKKYYSGSDREIRVLRSFGLSDRCRYYLTDSRIEAAYEKLVANLKETHIPLGLLHQYLPSQYESIRDGKIQCDPVEIIEDHILQVIVDYEFATRFMYLSD